MKHLRQELALIQVTFTVFVLLETWLVPFEGWLVDKFGPKLLVMLGGVLAGLGRAPPSITKGVGPDLSTDRKSTRLNSRDSPPSLDVLCLQKKTTGKHSQL